MVQSNRSALRALLVVLVGDVLEGCRESASEPERAPAVEAVRTATVPPAPVPSSIIRPPAVDAGVRVTATPASAWSRCASGFHPRSTPEVDAFRLGMLCGPSNGMLRWGPALAGEIGEDGQEGQHTVKVDSGTCVRFAVVASEGIEDLEVEVGPSTDKPEPAVLEQRWALLPEQGPLCVRSATALTITLRTHAGSGSYVVAGWRQR